MSSRPADPWESYGVTNNPDEPAAASSKPVSAAAATVVRAWERLGECEDEFGHDSDCCGEWTEALDEAVIGLRAALASAREESGTGGRNDA